MDTPTTAPTITTSTTPPAAMLSKKFLREGETPEAASATSGITIEAVSAAAVRPVTAFSLREALTSSLPLDLDAAAGVKALEGLTGSGLKKVSEEDWILFWLALGNGIAIVTAVVDAILLFQNQLLFLHNWLFQKSTHTILFTQWIVFEVQKKMHTHNK